MTKQEMERVKRTVIRKYPIFASIALLKVKIEEDNSISTAAVWSDVDKKGRLIVGGIKYNPDFFDNLTFSQQVFVIAHEVCHIAFKHLSRGSNIIKKDVEASYQKYCESVSDEKLRKIELKRLEKKYYNFWNIAADACINAFLKQDGLDFPKDVVDKRTGSAMNFVDIADGLYRNAEVIYDALVKKDNEKKKEHEQKSNNKNDNQRNNGGEESPIDSVFDDFDDFDVDNYQGIDSHNDWYKEVDSPSKDKNEGAENSSKDKNEESKSDNNQKPDGEETVIDKIKKFLGIGRNEKDKKDAQSNNSDEIKRDNISEEDEDEETDELIDEAKIFSENRTAREKKDNKSLTAALEDVLKGKSLGVIKPVKPVVSWKHLLIRAVEIEVELYGYRRASRAMPNSRLEDRTQDEKPITEVILDTSGSISEQLLKNFLYQLVPLFRESQIKVGCFAGRFYGFTELRTMEQIKEFTPIRDRDGTNYEAAATAFSKDNPSNRINKIVFTDGVLDNAPSHIQKTNVPGIIWVVFGDKMNFKPLSGKIIRVSKEDLNQMLGFVDAKELSGDDSELLVKRR